MQSHFRKYSARLGEVLDGFDWSPVEEFAKDLYSCWQEKRRVFICGNGGSAANAVHIANDFNYGISKKLGDGMRMHAIPANVSVLTCLANDEGYEHVFSHQLAVEANPGDLLLVLSGSGNSENVLRALDVAKQADVKSYAILGYSGGKALKMADVPIHFQIDDMQISEDLQMIVMHMLMQKLYKINKDGERV